MQRAIHVIILVLLGLLTGCSGLTTPDSDDWSEWRDAVGALPPSTTAGIKKLEAASAGRKWFNGRPYHEVPFDIGCQEDGLDTVYNYGGTTVLDVVNCLKSGDKTYTDCAVLLANDLARKLTAAGNQVTCWPVFLEGYDPLDLPSETNEDRLDTDDIAEFLIVLSVVELSKTPWLMSALGISATAGAMVGFEGLGLLLCPLSKAVMCPDDPGAPGVPQHAPDHGGER